MAGIKAQQNKHRRIKGVRNENDTNNNNNNEARIFLVDPGRHHDDIHLGREGEIAGNELAANPGPHSARISSPAAQAHSTF
jgi:hypothetical protein